MNGFVYLCIFFTEKEAAVLKAARAASKTSKKNSLRPQNVLNGNYSQLKLLLCC